MDEQERPRAADELPVARGLGNPFAVGGDPGGLVTVEYGVFREQLPVAGRSVTELRRVLGPRFDIDPRAIAIVDGDAVDNEHVVQAGQEVRFMHFSGEKGQHGLEDLLDGALHHALSMRRRPPTPRRNAPKVTIEGCIVKSTTPEGRIVTMPLEDLLAQLDHRGPGGPDARDIILPDGVKWVISQGPRMIVVHQTPPGVHNLKWVAAGSPARHGPGTRYRQARIALPYLIVFAVFEPRREGRLRLGDWNEAFFRSQPLCSPDDLLLYPALLNCSRFDRPDKPLSWICTQHLVRTRLASRAGNNERVRHGLGDLMRCLLDTGFNYSSEEHEISSWFTESTRVDVRVSTIERWQEATRKEPMFVSEVPWLEVGLSVRGVADRILNRLAGAPGRPRTSRDVMRVLCNRGEVQHEKGA